jgi:hypothetical protein
MIWEAQPSACTCKNSISFTFTIKIVPCDLTAAGIDTSAPNYDLDGSVWNYYIDAAQ